ncbi:TetR/AcrR family transcriptional regulator [Nakamurella silvestris]|nr:TetR/AcrR family transcriptional regulator [Nakamurella silvestris]
MRVDRNASRTRGELLAATVRALLTHGPGVSIEVVARLAEVSKGGLLHHFPTKAELFVAMFDEYCVRYDQDVARWLKEEDGSVGSIARAHIHATFNEPASDTYLWWRAACIAGLSGIPAVEERSRQAYREWQEEFDTDGLHPDRAAVIGQVLNGIALSALLITPAEASDERMRELLIALTRQPGPLV